LASAAYDNNATATPALLMIATVREAPSFWWRGVVICSSARPPELAMQDAQKSFLHNLERKSLRASGLRQKNSGFRYAHYARACIKGRPANRGYALGTKNNFAAAFCCKALFLNNLRQNFIGLRYAVYARR
jgi:hypothetical protein